MSLPPAWAERILAALLPAERRPNLLGDLAEEFQSVAARAGTRAAHRWYLGQVLRSVEPILRRRASVGLASLVLGREGPRTGAIFAVLALLWFGSVISFASFADLPPQPEVVAANLPPGVVALADGSAHPVYWLGGRDLAGDAIDGGGFEAQALIRLFALLLLPTAGAALTALLLLGLFDAFMPYRRFHGQFRISGRS